MAFQGAPGDPALAARLAALARRQAPVWLSLPAPAAQEDVEAWRIALHGLLEQHGSALTILELAVDRQPARLARFVAQMAATEVRANHDAIRLALGGPAMADRGRREDIYSAEMAPYVDLLAIPEGGESVSRVAASNRSACPHRADGAGPRRAGDSAGVVDGVLRDLGTEVVDARVARA